MNQNNPSPQIDCPIGLFEEVQPKIEDITSAINQAPTATEKARWAGELRDAVGPLLDCKAYDENNLNCRLCREFSQLRDKTAAVVQQAARLA